MDSDTRAGAPESSATLHEKDDVGGEGEEEKEERMSVLTNDVRTPLQEKKHRFVSDNKEDNFNHGRGAAEKPDSEQPQPGGLSDGNCGGGRNRQHWHDVMYRLCCLLVV